MILSVCVVLHWLHFVLCFRCDLACLLLLLFCFFLRPHNRLCLSSVCNCLHYSGCCFSCSNKQCLEQSALHNTNMSFFSISFDFLLFRNVCSASALNFFVYRLLVVSHNQLLFICLCVQCLLLPFVAVQLSFVLSLHSWYALAHTRTSCARAELVYITCALMPSRVAVWLSTCLFFVCGANRIASYICESHYP